jgi:uncharacterized protein (UPF0332 family)
MGRQLNRVYDKRLIGDYGTSFSIEREEADKILNIGKEFVYKILNNLKEDGIL